MTEARTDTAAAGDGADDLTLTIEPLEGPAGRALVDALTADLDERYADDGPADGDNPEVAGLHAVRAPQVTPPVGLFIVARLGGRPVGCGAVRALMGGPPGIGEIKRMYTVPEARRRGVSRVVLARLEREAAALGFHRVQLETGLRQPEAIALYEADGYHRVASFGQYEGDELSVCFAKDLPPA